MIRTVRAACFLVPLTLLAACHQRAAAPTINESMRGVMEPQAQAAWDIASKAYNDRGDALEARKISADDWAIVGQAGQQIKDRALLLADAAHVKVATANEPILGSQAVGQKGRIGKAWEAVDAGKVQSRINANPKLFAQHANDLAQAGADLVKAAAVKDADLFYRVTSGLDEVCDGCHEPFWGTDEPPPFPR